MLVKSQPQQVRNIYDIYSMSHDLLTGKNTYKKIQGMEKQNMGQAEKWLP